MIGRYLQLYSHGGYDMKTTRITVAKEIICVWKQKANKSLQDQVNVVQKVKKLYDEYMKEKRSRYKTSNTVQCRRNAFIEKLHSEFNIEGKKKISNILSKNDNSEPTKQNLSDYLSDLSDDQDDHDETDDINYVPYRRQTESENESLNFKLDRSVLSCLDRCNLSNRKAALVINSVASASGLNIMKEATSHETIRNRRKRTRNEATAEIRSTVSFGKMLTIHWDGKKMIDSTCGKNETAKNDRLAISISDEGNTKLLAIPKIVKTTGREQANIIHDTLIDWGIQDDVHMMSFDTTSTNTGKENGACAILQRMLGRSLFHLACRHHIYELTVSTAFTISMNEKTKGPEISIFTNFRKAWPNITQDAFTPAIEDELFSKQITLEKKQTIISFALGQMALLESDRDDYKELIELILLALGEESIGEKPITIKRPGAVHRARWMAKIIYAIKIFLFRKQFNITSK